MAYAVLFGFFSFNLNIFITLACAAALVFMLTRLSRSRGTEAATN